MTRRLPTKLVTASVVLMLSVATFADARPYTFAWDANSDGMTNGYFVFYGMGPGAYQPSAGTDVGNATQFQVDLIPGRTYYFAVRAYAANNVLSPMSYEFRFDVPPDSSTISVSATSVPAGGNVTATIAGGPGNRYDWVGLYAVGASSATPLTWKYLNGTQAAPASGVTSANVMFALPTTPGQYNLRFLSSNSYTVLATSATVTATGGTVVTTASISASPTTIAGGGTVTATVANGPGNRGDWVGLYPVANSASAPVAWKYLNGLQTAPATGMTAATVTFTVPTTAGQYNVRFVADNSNTVLATSATVTVSSVSTTTSVTASPTNVTGGGMVTATIAAGPGRQFDWVGLYPVGSANTAHLDWKYLSGSRTAPASGLTAATVSFNVPNVGGQYNIRFFTDNSYTLLATSAAVTVTASTTTSVTTSVTVTQTSVTAGSTVTATVANGPGSQTDWVGFYPVGNASTAYLDWKYLSNSRTAPATGLAGGVVTFTAPTTPGQYNVRFFSNNSYTLLATSATVTVTVTSTGPSVAVSSTTVARGGTISVNIANGPGGQYDWVGFYPVGKGDTSYADWKYLTNSRSAPSASMTGANVTFTAPTSPGQYNIRFFRDNGYGLIATSATVTVP